MELVVQNTQNIGPTKAFVLKEVALSSNPDVSVILLVYNTSKYLRKALDCLLSQTLQNIEIICVEDCSTDNSLDILKEYAQKSSKIAIVQNEKNLGAAVGRNAGLTYAHGRYLLILDSDDFYDSDMCEKMYQQALKDGSDVVVSGYYFATENGTDFKRKKYESKYLSASPFSPIKFKNRLFSFCSGNAWTKLFRADLVRENHIFFESLKSCNDYTFSYAMLAAASKISLIDDPFVHYRVNTGTNVSSYRGDKATCIIYAVNALFHHLKRFGKEKLYHKALMKTMISSFRWELRQCNEQEKVHFLEELPKILDEELYQHIKNNILPISVRFKQFFKRVFC